MNSPDHPSRSRLRKYVTAFLVFLVLLALAACGGVASSGNSASQPEKDVAPASVDSVNDENEEMSGDEAMPSEMSNGAMPAEETPEDDIAAGEMMDEGEHEMSAEEMAGGEMVGEDVSEVDMAGEMADETMSERPAWQEIELVNARTGETFTLGSFSGQRVFVEPMATWCTNCRQQLGNVQAAQEMAPEDAIFVALSVETTLEAEQLAKYADAAGFDWVFAVMTPDMLQALVDEFGRSIGNPPSTPHFVISADGSWTDLVTGIDAPEALIAQIEAAP